MREVKGKTALITGAARGMGAIWARRLAEDGANLVLWDLDDEATEQTAAPLREKGVDVLVQAVDVSDRQAVYQAALKVQAETGGVDVLVNNAGIVFARPFLETPDEKIAATLDVDLKALFWTTKAFLPRMIERNEGHIVNVSSASGFIGVPRMPAYVASKWGVIGLTESLRYELKEMGKTGIRFTLFCPSFVDTGMFEGVRPPRLTKMLDPEAAVARAYKGFKQDEYLILEPLMVRLTPVLKGVLPMGAFDRLAELLGVTKSMDTWQGEKR